MCQGHLEARRQREAGCGWIFKHINLSRVKSYQNHQGGYFKAHMLPKDSDGTSKRCYLLPFPSTPSKNQEPFNTMSSFPAGGNDTNPSIILCTLVAKEWGTYQ